MKRTRYFYLIRIQYLGFRYSGWQKQPGRKTVEGMLDKTFKHVLPDAKFKILGSGRTDSKVSALDGVFELFLDDTPLPDFETFLPIFNRNLPPDIRALDIKSVSKDFNIIKNSKSKEYVYLFSYGEKNHPFCAPFLYNVIENLNISLMKEVAPHFVGTHDFSTYTARLKPNTQVIRTVDYCEILENDLIYGSFFPNNSYKLVVRGQGFMRYQIRMIMGALIQLGKGELGEQEILDSLNPDIKLRLTTVAPGSGLILNEVKFD
ncbi:MULTISPECIES: tRNA pseudouridine synthase A [Maribacter]|uniref:tRNA pseudouridine synthase A n=1 Tax=Maribacter flavus TaxID=1658664 RepID=A0ABU7IKC8_9FLAO|nr:MULTISPECIES: tRNA pseudouridine(38-40) synthase TruA [Maribacter]MDC6405959.1 tRNA pseudouridine(38-40) synthase TruA [Maribacter sp. PR66]MEE1973256.1 tRNA pseudouridine(38-40) synthase TruA [Maribacter flavus]